MWAQGKPAYAQHEDDLANTPPESWSSLCQDFMDRMRTPPVFAGFQRLACLKMIQRVEIVEDALKEAAQPSAEGYENSVRVH